MEDPQCDGLVKDIFTKVDKSLTDEEKSRLEAQNHRLVPEFKAQKLEEQAQRHWDIFYKRNETHFFKDRRWTTREFEELLDFEDEKRNGNIGCSKEPRRLFEVGCGVGNLIFPLIEEQEEKKLEAKRAWFYYACDFSPRAIEFLRSNPLYDEQRINAFQCDITTDQIHAHIPESSLDIVTMIFVLSAIHPNKFNTVVENIYRLLKPGGVVLFRDYGRYDMAQLRFKPGNKIAENFYMRQDGTRSYFFAEAELASLFTDADRFEVVENSYVHRRTLNIKEGIDVPRIFLQSKFRKR
ncbi:tRNA N(3)-methylcytidine methyltransferase METTL6 [Zeugodacus cucurbitae]|uniref:tRNA N(3)-methylcytidine methyltransferase METTL6 n=1 Tax=Zeugodacus cucurbitae TaxID=28588 RepID=UPI0023D96B04|nr:tRNA N(3)-methylcytidine methyltransferase METTL6 [Zeugodacus cucurbitae]